MSVFLLTIFLRLIFFTQRALKLQLTRLWIACNKWVSLKVLEAGAKWSVVNRFTPGILSAGLFTRVRTGVLHTGAVHWAVGMKNTLGPTGRWGPDGSGQTGASAPVAVNLGLTVRTANSFSARVFSFCFG